VFQSSLDVIFGTIHDWLKQKAARHHRVTARVRNVTAIAIENFSISTLSPSSSSSSSMRSMSKTIAMATQSYITKVLEELGLVSLYKSPIDTKLLCTQRFVRLFAYGGSTLILVSYLTELGILYDKTGIFMTLTLVGDVLISFCLTLVADGLGRKTILVLGAALMAGSGVIFGLSGNYWVLLLAAIFGVISPR